MIQAFAVQKPGGKLEPFEYNPGILGAHEVEIDVESCGICFSDISMIDNAWNSSHYPLVPGHEVIGTIAAIGDDVHHLKIGDRVGLGWHAGYCMACQQCMSGSHNLCPEMKATIVNHHGGFANKVRAMSPSVVRLPKDLDPESAGPLLCGGNTVFNPLIQKGVKPTDHVGVIGIGGLGHMALKFLRAWGCEVTAFTSTASKQEEALGLGAHHTINSKDPKAVKNVSNTFDFIMGTINCPLNWNAYLQALKPNGKLHLLGAVSKPIEFDLRLLLSGQKSISSSPPGSPSNISLMLEFAARHKIQPVIETFSFDEVNEAIDHLRQGKARYRIVLNW